MKKIILTLSFSLLLLLGTAVPKSDQEDSKAVLAAELLTKLKSSQVKVIAAGHVSGQLSLFISGSGSKTDFSGGYQVTVGSDPGDGRFDVDSVEKLAGKYSGFGKATDSMFLCSDSDSSSSLIAMDSNGVGAFNLAQNKFTPLKIVNNDAMAVCYKSGEIFFASNKPKHYYQLEDGSVTYYEFVGKTIAEAGGCGPNPSLGHLCATGKGGDAKITIASSCSESPPSDITAGYIGDSKAYLFDKDNAVYYFDASIFQGGGQQSVKLTKVPSFQAWFTLASISTANPHELKTTTEGGGGASAATTIVIIVFVVVLLLCIAAGVTVYCKYGKKEDGDDKGKKEKKEKDSKSGSQKSGQKSSSSQGENKKKKNTPSAKGSGGGRPQPTKSTVKSKPSGAGSSVSNQGEEEGGVSSSSAEGGSSKAKTKTAALKGKRSSVSNRGKMGGGGGSSSSSRGLKKLPGGKLLLKKKNKMGKNKMRSGKAKKSLGGKTAKKVSSEKNRSQSKKTAGRSQSRRGSSSKGRGVPPGLQAADLKDMKSLANLGLESTSAAAAAAEPEE